LTKQLLHNIIINFLAFVWLVNGHICKVLNIVPRHEQIVAKFMGESIARPVTLMLGLAEIAMAIWILSRNKPRLNAITQMTIVLTMNILEYFYASEYLLWGKLNAVFAVLFLCLVYYNEFILRKELNSNY